ncbi:acetylcholinesterase-like [Schistocerca serialis cubense]|uniref:acetylcholinesterase-like n=1 Tax=Schistocerca serialis cubense TaxID=2023355 RepID=UPI00214F0BCC|nr:acetylcholinesterase-like [Schistocerca serialis cubense]
MGSHGGMEQDKDSKTLFTCVWVPSAEPVNDGAFLTEEPWIALSEGRYNLVPFMAGNTDLERVGHTQPGGSLSTEAKIENLNENFGEIVGCDLRLPTKEERVEGAESVKKFYYNGSDITLKDNYTTALAQEYVTVEIQEGTLRGQVSKTFTDKAMFMFEGIPYAEPPVGDLRFQPPVAKAAWSDVRDALALGSHCPQIEDNEAVGNEDCLHLNVYGPEAALQKQELKAVMVWIHGGCFTGTSGDSAIPNYYVDQDIVFVSINYRLGLLGFLSTGDEVVPGNMGLKDQTEALRWVQRNIAVFGGDPEKVTIFGQSAGGASIHYHVVSPLSTAGGSLSTEAQIENLNENFGEIVGCDLRLPTKEERLEGAEAVKEFYYNGSDITLKDNYTTALFDSHLFFVEGVDAAVRSMSRLSSQPVYYYQFSYVGPLSLYPGGPGAAHADDMRYMYTTPTDLNPNSDGGIIRAQMIEMWANFAKYDNPTPEQTSLLTEVWKEYNESSQYYLEITRPLRLKTNLFEPYMIFWQNLLPS